MFSITASCLGVLSSRNEMETEVQRSWSAPRLTLFDAES